jgi:hypothetical protein
MKDIYKVEEEALSVEIMDFIVQWHYSKSYRSLKQKHVFTLRTHDNTLVGVAIYGQPMGTNVDNDKYIELRRFCLIDNTQKNTESFFLGKTLRLLKELDTPPYVLSYTDPNVGHNGTIYKASNFVFTGAEKTPNPRVLLLDDGKKVHIRQLYAKLNGEYTKAAIKFQELIKEGKAKVIKQKHKLRFEYQLRR